MSSRGPVYREGEEIVIGLGDDAARIINGLIDELVAVVRSDDHELRDRLFPRASTDEEIASEYAHYMDRELVESRLESFDAFRKVITDLPARIDEVQFNSVMHAINALRLVLGDVLEVSDDPDADTEVAPALVDSPEHRLYDYLSWLLEWCVMAATGRS